MVSVAIDVQGAEKARPWVEKAKATYTTLVDPYNELGRQFNFNFVPLAILFDEEGRMVRGPRGINVSKDEDRAGIEQWIKGGMVHAGSEPKKPSGFTGPDAELRFQAAALLLSEGKNESALRLLKKALSYDPRNWLIRKQIWAIENPARFYSGSVDYKWQKQQLEKEKAASGSK